MPDNPTDKPSNESARDASPAGDIDDILSQASSLADELAEQVGVPDDHASLSQDDAAVLPDGDAIDAQLAQVEQQLAETQSEVADLPETKQPEAAPMDYKAAAAALGDTLADSPEPEVAESVADSSQTPPTKSATESPAPPDATPPNEAAAQLGRRESDASAEGKDAGDAVASTAYELNPEDLADGEDLPTFDDAPEASPVPKQPDGGTPTSPPAQGGAMATNALGAICMALEVIDAPFQRVGEMPRRVIGWVGLALLFAAFLIFVLTFFQ